MKSVYKEIPIQQIELDFDNPRIAKYIEIYGKDQISSEALALALGGGTDDTSGTSYSSLKESIKANGGIIHPIIVNCIKNEKYVVIEGNTRVQIYREFSLREVPGEWDDIRALVYDNLPEESIHAIRLQAHLVGPREWDPYSKAKYLHYLSEHEKLPLQQVIAFCGGKTNDVKKMIDAYNDMEDYYRPVLESDTDFDARDFSKFMELQNKGVKDVLLVNKYDITHFAKWVIKGNIDTAQNVRKIPQIFKSEEAKQTFLKKNISEAMKIIAIEDTHTGDISTVPYFVLADELARKIRIIEYSEVKNLRANSEFEDRKNILLDLLDELKTLADDISEE